MRYLHVIAGGHGLLIEAARVGRVLLEPPGVAGPGAAEFEGAESGGAVLDVSAALSGGTAVGCVWVGRLDGPALAVDQVRGLVDVADEGLAATPWLPAAAAALLDAVALQPVGGSRPWRLRLS